MQSSCICRYHRNVAELTNSKALFSDTPARDLCVTVRSRRAKKKMQWGFLRSCIEAVDVCGMFLIRAR